MTLALRAILAGAVLLAAAPAVANAAPPPAHPPIPIPGITSPGPLPFAGQAWPAKLLITVAAARSPAFVQANAPTLNTRRPDQEIPPAIPAGAEGYDISWPQCGATPPVPPFDFAIIGVTGGRALTENGCLQDEVTWAGGATTTPQAYINLNELPPSWSTPACPSGDTACRAYQYGVATATAAVDYAAAKGIHAGAWWLDVELENDWSAAVVENAGVIRGASETLQARGFQTGIYSTPLQWKQIAGTYSPGLDVWLAGASSREDAAELCDADHSPFNGGALRYVQFVADDLDHDYAC